MLHGEVIYAVVFSGTGFASDAVGVALECGGAIPRTPTGALHHHPRNGVQMVLDELKAHPVPEISVPPYPNYHKGDELGKP
jgi:hypothetical protein